MYENDLSNNQPDRKIKYGLDIHDLNSLVDYCFTYFMNQEGDILHDFNMLKSEMNFISTCTTKEVEVELEKILKRLLKEHRVIDHNFYRFIRLFVYSMRYDQKDSHINANCEKCGSRSTCNKLYLQRIEAIKG